VIDGVKSTLDEFRGTPYIQTDLCVGRPIKFHERWSLTPFIEFFNLFNRSNSGNNYVGNISALPVPVNNLANVTAAMPYSGLLCAGHQRQAVARPRRRPRRFFRSRHHRRNPLRRPTRPQTHLLNPLLSTRAPSFERRDASTCYASFPP